MNDEVGKNNGCGLRSFQAVSLMSQNPNAGARLLEVYTNHG